MKDPHVLRPHARRNQALDAQKKSLGQRAEGVAATLYEREGYHIVARNLRVGRAEIDLVVAHPRKQRLVFVEVRARSSTLVHPAWTIDAAKQARIRSAALQWLRDDSQAGPPPALRRFAIAFDVLTFLRVSGTWRMDYYPNAF